MAAGSQVGASAVPRASLTTWAPAYAASPRAQGVRDRLCCHLRQRSDEASAGIQAAINACPEGQVVQLSAGTFTVNNYILINKGITLRGAGLRTTILQKTNQLAEQEQILIVGPSRWPRLDETTAVNLTADAVKGAMSVTVQNATGFTPGQFVKLDEDDYTTATWMRCQLVSKGARRGPGDRSRRLANPRPSQQGDLPLPGGLSWHSRPGRPLAEIKEVTAVRGILSRSPPRCTSPTRRRRPDSSSGTPARTQYTSARRRRGHDPHRWLGR